MYTKIINFLNENYKEYQIKLIQQADAPLHQNKFKKNKWKLTQLAEVPLRNSPEMKVMLLSQKRHFPFVPNAEVDIVFFVRVRCYRLATHTLAGFRCHSSVNRTMLWFDYYKLARW